MTSLMTKWTGARAAARAMAMLVSIPAAAQQVHAPAGYVPLQALSYGTAETPAVPVDTAHPLPVAGQGRPVSYADRSGSIAAGGTAQALSGANPNRTGFMIENLSTSDLWIMSGGTATAGQPSFRVGAGQLFEFPVSGVPGTALSIVGATTGQSFAAREW